MIGTDLDPVVERMLASRAARLARADAIMNAPEAEGRTLLAFGLDLRPDLTADAAVRILASAPPGLRDVAGISAFCASVPTQPDPEPVQ